MKPVDLSIIIVSFNTRDYLKNCLNSIYENISDTISYEIIVVDNNSHDGSLQMLQEYFPQIKVIDNNDNVGFAKANNQAIKISQGRYLVLLNSDTFVLGNCFERLIQFMDEHRTVGALSPKLLEGDAKTVQLQGGGWNKKQWLSDKPLAVKFICGAAFMIRRDTYKNVGGLDEKFFFYNEDLDWCKRIIDNGWKIFYYPESAVIHYGGKSTGAISKRAIIEGIKGGVYYAYKHYRWLLILYIPLILVFLLCGVLYNSMLLLFSKKRKVSWEKIQGYLYLIYIVSAAKYR